ncbi:MAG: hypothetical protein DCF21_06265 [Leptolyngbya sp.]|uniref:Uncharacterized protein n=1 Tax=Shackletoniella antarctica TaxID=268115 RepID=A0A2W4WGS5_9CYAN|nr:MAG: hypothetical protein DCF17_05485 [Shackletoniella antarctica]PZV19928.1 MAG: hypothetical protein DCF21_06265 [Leptolyngbya sp.]
MADLLEQAIARVKALSVDEQNTIATLILEELEDESRWDTSFAGSHNLLAELAAEAMAEYHAGNSQELDPKKLLLRRL